MTKKDYIKIADILNLLVKSFTLNKNGQYSKFEINLILNQIIFKFAGMLKADNTRFDAERFLTAVNKDITR